MINSVLRRSTRQEGCGIVEFVVCAIRNTSTYIGETHEAVSTESNVYTCISTASSAGPAQQEYI